MDNETNISSQEKLISLGAGGALTALGASLLLKGRVLPAIGALAAGGALLYRGKTQHCATYQALGIDTAHENAAQPKGQDGPVKLTHVVTVNKSAAEIYKFWRDAANYAKFMPQIESVEKLSDTHFKWTAKLPADKTLNWESEIVEDKPNQMLRWETKNEDVTDLAVPHSGELTLKELPHNRGTQVKLEITNHPQTGAIGAALAQLFKAAPSQFTLESLRRFKQLMEAGELANSNNQPA